MDVAIMVLALLTVDGDVVLVAPLAAVSDAVLLAAVDVDLLATVDVDLMMVDSSMADLANIMVAKDSNMVPQLPD